MNKSHPSIRLLIFNRHIFIRIIFFSLQLFLISHQWKDGWDFDWICPIGLGNQPECAVASADASSNRQRASIKVGGKELTRKNRKRDVKYQLFALPQFPSIEQGLGNRLGSSLEVIDLFALFEMKIFIHAGPRDECEFFFFLSFFFLKDSWDSWDSWDSDRVVLACRKLLPAGVFRLEFYGVSSV